MKSLCTQYEFVSVKINALTGKSKEGYKEIIKDFAKKGWRLKQIVTPPSAAGGQALYMDIIFEREKQD